jgi:hypothetical protein
MRTTSLEAVPNTMCGQKKRGKNINKERKEKIAALVGGQRARSSSSNTRLVQQHDDLTMYSHSVAVLHPAVSREDSHSHQTGHMTCVGTCVVRHSNHCQSILLCAALSTLSRTRVSRVGMLQCISLATRTRCINVRSRCRVCVCVRVLVCMCALAVPTARVRARASTSSRTIGEQQRDTSHQRVHHQRAHRRRVVVAVAVVVAAAAVVVVVVVVDRTHRTHILSTT